MKRLVPWARGVDKAIYSADQVALSRMLKQLRLDAGLRQVDVAAALDVPQSFVSKYESGERRLDILELRQVCLALGVAFTTVTNKLDRELAPGTYDERAALRSAEPAGPSSEDTGPPVDEAG